MPDNPSISVIASAYFNRRHNKITLAHLRQQTIADQIELVLVSHENAEGKLDADWLAGFHSIKQVTASFKNIGEANWHGFQVATAPIIALTEDHCFMQEDWAEVLIREHNRNPNIAVVGPVVHNANPRTAISRAAFITGYGIWSQPHQEISHLPGHNSSYKRDILIAEYSKHELLPYMEAESQMHWDLLRKGYQLVHSQDLNVWHVNTSRFRTHLEASIVFGRLFGMTRARNWSRTRRMVYSLLSPLVPFLRLYRLLATVSTAEIVRVLPLILLTYVCATIGEVQGYLLPNTQIAFTAHLEWNRYMLVDERDRAMLQNVPYKVSNEN